MENIVSFNAVSTSKVKYTSNASATKNIKNVNLLDSTLTNQEKNINVLEENANIELTDNPLAEYTFEELLKEGQETKKEVQLQRDKKAVQEAVEVIDKIGEVNLSSGPDIEAAKAAYANLTEEQKALIDPKYLEKIEAAEAELKRQQIEEERRRKEEEAAARQAKLDELEALYKARDENNGFWHPIREAEIEAAIRELEAELDVPHQPDGWEKFTDKVEDAGAYAATFVGSTVEGFVDLGEGLIDGTIYGVSKTLQVFGVDDKWAEDIIAYDFSAEMYDAFVDAAGIDKEIAYGPTRTIGNFVGEMAGYYALSCVPYAGPVLCCVAGAGSSVEDSINTQLAETGEVNDWKVFGASVLGALEGYGFGKAAKGLSQGFKAIKSAGGLKGAVKGVVNSVSKESVKSTLKQSGKIAAKTVATTATDADTYVETATVLADDIMNGIETGEWNVGGMIAETATVFGENYVSNLTAGMWEANSNITSDMAKTAKKNYKDHSSDFTSKADYYADLAYVEKNNYWTTDVDGNDVHMVLDKNDAGITSCLTNDAKVKWATAVSECTDVNGMTRVNLAHTNSDVFTKYVLGEGSEYGTFGISGNYNFARLGDANPDGFMKNATDSGNDLISQFKSESGIPIGAQKNDRIIFCSHDVDVNDVSMHTGKELNSYSERLPGGRLPNGDYEVSYSSQQITSETAKGTAIIVKDGNGNDIWNGTLEELKDYQINNPDRYKSIVYG